MVDLPATASPESPFARSSDAHNRPLHRGYRGEPNVRLEFPIGFFCADVLLHQFRDDLVLLDQLGPLPGSLFRLGGELLGLPGGRPTRRDRTRFSARCRFGWA